MIPSEGGILNNPTNKIAACIAIVATAERVICDSNIFVTAQKQVVMNASNTKTANMIPNKNLIIVNP